MRAPLSIVIPTLNAEADLPGCLATLMEGIDAGLIRELVVSDGGSKDATLSIAADVGATVVTGATGRGGQLITGAEAAAGDWLLFLHADSQLSEGWSDAVAAHLATGGPGYFALGFRAAGFMPRVVAGWANMRSRLFSMPYGDQGLLISRDDYDAIGGYADIPLMEDVAIARVLGARLTRLDATVITSAARYQKGGWLRRGGRNLWTLTRYLLGVSPETLARGYRKT